jgi:hypothetical protein
MREPTYAAFDKARKQIAAAVDAVVAENTSATENTDLQEQKPVV